jgi:hypothetical protein
LGQAKSRMVSSPGSEHGHQPGRRRNPRRQGGHNLTGARGSTECSVSNRSVAQRKASSCPPTERRNAIKPHPRAIPVVAPINIDCADQNARNVHRVTEVVTFVRAVEIDRRGQAQLGGAQIRADQMGAHQIGATQIGATQIGAIQIGAIQIGATSTATSISRFLASV